MLLPILLIIAGYLLSILGAIFQWREENLNGAKHHTYILVFGLVGLTIVAGTGINQTFEQKKSEKLSDKRQNKIDSLTSYILNLQKEQLDSSKKIILKSEMIIALQNESGNEIINGFKESFVKQQSLLNQTYRLQNTIPNELVATLNIRFENEELYKYAVNLRKKNLQQWGYTFMSPGRFDTTIAFRKLDTYITTILKDFSISATVKENKTRLTLLAADKVIDLVKQQDWNEYDKTGTVDKTLPFAFITLDENNHCFMMHVSNIKMNVLYKDKKVISNDDLERSTLYLTIGYKNTYLPEMGIRDGNNPAEKAFNNIYITHFYLSSGLSLRASYCNLKDTLGVFIIKNFEWKEHIPNGF